MSRTKGAEESSALQTVPEKSALTLGKVTEGGRFKVCILDDLGASMMLGELDRAVRLVWDFESRPLSSHPGEAVGTAYGDGGPGRRFWRFMRAVRRLALRQG